MRLVLCALALAAASCGPAMAKETPNAAAAGKDAMAQPAAAAPRTLYICENSAMTRRAFAREFGSIQFVKAEAVTSKGEAWTFSRR